MQSFFLYACCGGRDNLFLGIIFDCFNDKIFLGDNGSLGKGLQTGCRCFNLYRPLGFRDTSMCCVVL